MLRVSDCEGCGEVRATIPISHGGEVVYEYDYCKCWAGDTTSPRKAAAEFVMEQLGFDLVFERSLYPWHDVAIAYRYPYRMGYVWGYSIEPRRKKYRLEKFGKPCLSCGELMVGREYCSKSCEERYLSLIRDEAIQQAEKERCLRQVRKVKKLTGQAKTALRKGNHEALQLLREELRQAATSPK